MAAHDRGLQKIVCGSYQGTLDIMSLRKKMHCNLCSDRQLPWMGEGTSGAVFTYQASFHVWKPWLANEPILCSIPWESPEVTRKNSLLRLIR